MRLFIGYDPKEDDAYRVCRSSFLKHNPGWQVAKLDLRLFSAAGIFNRPFMEDGPGYVDLVENRPFSTQFAFSRFLVPYLCGFEGTAVFCDSDFLWRKGLAEGGAVINSGETLCVLHERYCQDAAVTVVKHRYAPSETEKMSGQSQVNYPRKNWSSLVVWNCGHPANRILTPELVSKETGRYLHGFQWLEDDEIQGLHERYNWLEGHSNPMDVVGVHYTRGVPSRRSGISAFADEWWSYLPKEAAA